jgi:thiamine phosphate synthase YjbQ (UPF0047 family)
MVQQVDFKLRPRYRGFHLITDEVLQNLPTLPKTGLLNLFIKHTSYALSICENCSKGTLSAAFGKAQANLALRSFARQLGSLSSC